MILRRELRGKFKQLARLMDMEQFDHFISSLRKEQQLCHRISELIQYRKNGITKHSGERREGGRGAKLGRGGSCIVEIFRLCRV